MHRNSTTVSTKQQRIATLAKQSPQMAFTSLAYLMDIDWLKEAYRRTRKDGAAGVDGVTAEEYEQDLEGNLQSLLDRAKSGKPDGKGGGGDDGDGGGDPPPVTAPFRYELTWLPNPIVDPASDYFYVQPLSINDQGVTVGYYYSDDFSQRSGFMATAETGLVDLNDVIQEAG